MQTLIVPSDQIRDMEGLSLLVSGLERVTGGGKINVRQAVVIETECVPAFFMLQDLLIGKDRQLPAPDSLAQIEAPKGDTEQKSGTLYSRGNSKLHKSHGQKAGKSISIKGTYPAGDRPEKAHKQVIAAWKVTHSLDETVQIGDLFTGQAVGKGIKSGRFLPGTKFHHPKFGSMVVDVNRCLVAVAAETAVPA
jgi:hypothetical protein